MKPGAPQIWQAFPGNVLYDKPLGDMAGGPDQGCSDVLGATGFTGGHLAKYLASDAGFFAADRALQTHGGFGYANELLHAGRDPEAVERLAGVVVDDAQLRPEPWVVSDPWLVDAANADDPNRWNGEPLAQAQGRIAHDWVLRLDPDLGSDGFGAADGRNTII